MGSEFTIHGHSGIFGSGLFHSYNIGWGHLWFSPRIAMTRGATILSTASVPFLQIIDHCRLRSVGGEFTERMLYVDGQFSRRPWEPYLEHAWFVETEYAPGEEMDNRVRALQARREKIPFTPDLCVLCMSKEIDDASK